MRPPVIATSTTFPIARGLALAAVALLGIGCSGAPSLPEVVVYTALDREFSESILNEYARQENVIVLPKYDLESTKTVGLAAAIRAEANHPRCDVFWNNEILHTLRLESQGLLEVYYPPPAESYPEMYRSPRGTWHGFAGRARVLLVNTKIVREREFPHSIHDLADPRWKGKVGIAKPVFGTTATHAACLFSKLGNERAEAFFRSLKANQIQILSGNKQVATAVGRGQLAFGLTDTDDAIGELERGSPIKIIYPDQEASAIGTLFIPNTLAIVKNCPHPPQARQLVDHLLSPAVEIALANCPSAQIPLNSAVQDQSRVLPASSVRAMQVDFQAAAEKWDAAMNFLKQEFLAP